MTVAEQSDQRARILDAALRLMGTGGAHATSMRSLANECGLNVATLYHYFPSKAELLREVIDHQSYDELLAQLPPIDVGLPSRERLAALLVWIWREMVTQEDMWRLLLGESLYGDPEALSSAAELSATFETGLVRWLAGLFDDGELGGDLRLMARTLRGVIYGFFVENLPLPGPARIEVLAQRADEVATVLTRPT